MPRQTPCDDCHKIGSECICRGSDRQLGLTPNRPVTTGPTGGRGAVGTSVSVPASVKNPRDSKKDQREAPQGTNPDLPAESSKGARTAKDTKGASTKSTHSAGSGGTSAQVPASGQQAKLPHGAHSAQPTPTQGPKVTSRSGSIDSAAGSGQGPQYAQPLSRQDTSSSVSSQKSAAGTHQRSSNSPRPKPQGPEKNVSKAKSIRSLSSAKSSKFVQGTHDPNKSEVSMQSGGSGQPSRAEPTAKAKGKAKQRFATANDLPPELVTPILGYIKERDQAEAGDGRNFAALAQVSKKFHMAVTPYLYRAFPHFAVFFTALFARTLQAESRLAEVIEFVKYGQRKDESSPPRLGKHDPSEVSENTSDRLGSVVDQVYPTGSDMGLKNRWLEGLRVDKGKKCDDWSVVAVVLCLVANVKSLDLLHNRPRSLESNNNDYFATGLLGPLPSPLARFPNFSSLEKLCVDMYKIPGHHLARTLQIPSLRVLVLGNLYGSFAEQAKFPIRTSNVEKLVMHKSLVGLAEFRHLIKSFRHLKVLDYSCRRHQFPSGALDTNAIQGDDFVHELYQSQNESLQTLKIRGRITNTDMISLQGFDVLSEVMVPVALLPTENEDDTDIECLADYFSRSLRTLHIVENDMFTPILPGFEEFAAPDRLGSFPSRGPVSFPYLEQVAVMWTKRDPPETFTPFNNLVSEFQSMGAALKFQADDEYDVEHVARW